MSRRRTGRAARTFAAVRLAGGARPGDELCVKVTHPPLQFCRPPRPAATKGRSLECYDALPAPIRAALQEGPEELDPLWARSCLRRLRRAGEDEASAVVWWSGISVGYTAATSPRPLPGSLQDTAATRLSLHPTSSPTPRCRPPGEGLRHERATHPAAASAGRSVAANVAGRNAVCANSIRANGQREPITLHRDGRVLHHSIGPRLHRTGHSDRRKTFEVPAPTCWGCIDLNLKRRHLTESQRAIIQPRLRLGRGRPSNNAVQAAFTQAAAAKKFRSAPIVSNALAWCSNTPSRRSSPPSRMASYRSRWRPPSRRTPRATTRQARARPAKAAGTYRHEEDYYRTPPECVRALLAKESVQPHDLGTGLRRWPDLAGAGGVRHTVISTDLIDRGSVKVAWTSSPSRRCALRSDHQPAV